MARLESLDLSLSARTEKLNRGLKDARRSLRKFSRDMKRSLGGLTKFAAGTAVAVSAAFVGLSREVINSADQMAKAATTFGVSFETFQALSIIFDRAGLDLAKLREGLSRMSLAVGEARAGTQTYVDALARLGLRYQDLERLTPDMQLSLVLDKLAEIPDVAQRNVAAYRLLGEEFSRLIGPLLELEGGIEGQTERLHDLGLIMNEEIGVSAQDLKDAFEDMGLAIKVNFANALSDALGAGRDFDRVIKDIGVGTEKLTKFFIGLAKAVQNLNISFDRLFSILQFVLPALIFGKIFGAVQGITLAFASLATKGLARFARMGGVAKKAADKLFNAIQAVEGLLPIGAAGYVGVELFNALGDLREEIGKIGKGTEEANAAAKDLTATWTKLREDLGKGIVHRLETVPESLRQSYKEIVEMLGFRFAKTATGAVKEVIDEVKDLETELRTVAKTFDEVAARMAHVTAGQAPGGPISSEARRRLGIPWSPDEIPDFMPSIAGRRRRGGGEIGAEAMAIGAETQGVFAGLSDDTKQSIKDFGTNVRENLKAALLTGNFKDLGKAFITALQTALIDNLFKIGGNLLSGALGLGTGATPAGASGRHVNAMSPFLVGEMGPEVFVPAVRGQIVPNRMLGGGKQVNQTFNFPITGDVSRQTRSIIRRDAESIASQLAAVERERGVVS